MGRNPTYFDGDLRQRLLSEALAVMQCDGPDAVSLRGLARVIGVSHAAPRHHFADKSRLFAALAIESFELVARQLDADGAPRSDDRDVFDRIRRVAVGYVRWARCHRARYRLVLRPELHRHDREVAAAREATYARWTTLLREGQAAGLGRDLPWETLREFSWTLVTGLALRAVDEPAGHEPAVEAMIDVTIELLRPG